MNIHKRIKDARMKLGLSQGALAKLIGVSRTTVSWWETEGGNSTSPIGENLLKCARALHVTPEWLQLGEEKKLNNHNITNKSESKLTDNYRLYPLLFPHEVVIWLLENKLPTGRKIEMLPSPTNASEKSFNIDISEDGSSAVFMPTRTFFNRLTALIDPKAKPQLNSIVWVKVSEKDFKLRQYFKDGHDIYLKSLDDSYPTIKLEEDMEIIGVMVCLNQDFATGHDIANDVALSN